MKIAGRINRPCLLYTSGNIRKLQQRVVIFAVAVGRNQDGRRPAALHAAQRLHRRRGNASVSYTHLKQVASGQMMLGGLAAVSLLVAALNIANTMTMAIYERTKEIGVMKEMCIRDSIRPDRCAAVPPDCCRTAVQS